MDQKKIIPFAFVIAFMCIYPHSALFAQDGVLINYTGGSRAASAILDLQSSDQGLLAPRVALTATNAASPITSPATSLLVYNTATAGSSPNDVTPGYYYWDGSWKKLLSSNAITTTAWLQNGNAGTTASTSAIGTPANNNFIGTTDAKDFVLATNDLERIRIASGGNVGIGTAVPAALLHLQSTNITDVPQGEIVLSRYWSSNTNTRASSIFHYISSVTGKDNLAFAVSGDGGTYAQPNQLSQIKMIIQATGNVGIGVTNPVEKLTVAGNLFLASSRSEIYGNDRNHMIVLRGDQAGNGADEINYYEYGGTLAQALGHRFFTGGLAANQTERMRISNDGIYMRDNVGIGTAAPTGRLQVSGGRSLISQLTNVPSPSYDDADLVIGDDATTRNGFGGTNGSHILLQSSDKSTITALDQGNDLGQISYQNLKWTIGENVGWGAQTLKFPAYANGLLKVDGSGNVSVATGTDVPSGSNYYIQNQNAADQAANFRINGLGNISNGNPYAIPNNRMAAGSLAIGGITTNYGGGNNWNTNTAGLMLETLDNTEIAVHDAGHRVASLMYYEGGSTNRITIGRDMYVGGWGAISTVAINGNVGIGIAAPTQNLDIAGQVRIRGGSPGLGKVLVSDATGSASWITIAGSGYGDNLGNHTATATLNMNAYNTQFNTGVGPYWAANSDAGFITFRSTGDGVGQSYLEIGTTDNGDEPILFTQTGSERMRVHTNGSVGIGTNNPEEKLHVSDNIRADGIVYWGDSQTRTESRADAGLQGNAGARSGFYQTSVPAPAANWPTGASSWWHMMDTRHSNGGNNYAMQFAGSFFDQDLFIRKTNNNPAQGWKRVVTSGNVAYSQNRNTFSLNNSNVGYRTVGDATNSLTVKTGDVIVITHTSKFRWTGGSNGDHPFYGISVSGACSTSITDIERIGTADDVPRGQWQVIATNYVWVATCSGDVQFTLYVDNNTDADDNSEFRDIVIIAQRY